ncbi:MAG: DNA repair exonuclease, partial [Burkholderiales bacterium]
GAIGLAEASCRSVRAELDGLRLQPTAEDIAALAADGYLANVLTELRERQHGDQAEVATHALGLLAGILRERGTGKAAT